MREQSQVAGPYTWTDFIELGEDDPRELVSELSPQLAGVCAKAMATDPDRRHQTASELRSELACYLAGAGARRASAVRRVAVWTRSLWRRAHSVDGVRPRLVLNRTSDGILGA